MKKTDKDPKRRLYEYRIEYNAGAENSAQNSYHYYNAFNAPQALDFHLKMLEKRKITVQTISIAKLNPFSERWEDESSILHSFHNE
tara:strand:- start:1490 stop:1747 length:258 start_codon:yes stop_codon:yes gene_type:complete